MPALVDTTVRLLSQEPLAGSVPTASILDLAEILDGRVRRARGLRRRLRQRRSARRRIPVGADSRDRRAHEDAARDGPPWTLPRGLTPGRRRLRPPLRDDRRGERDQSLPAPRSAQRRLEPSRGRRGDHLADREFDAGLIYSPGPTGETDTLVEQAKKLPDLGGGIVSTTRPARSSPTTARARLRPSRRRAGYQSGSTARARAEAHSPRLLEAARAGADRIACATYPVALILTVSGEGLADALRGLSLDAGVDVSTLWKAAELVDEHIGDAPVTPLATRVAVRAAAHNLPAGSSPRSTPTCAQSAGDRLDEVLGELEKIRAEAGWPPLAAPIGQILGSQALVHVLSASRYQVVVDELRALFRGEFGKPLAEFDPTAQRAVDLLSDGGTVEKPAADLDELRDDARGLAASDEEPLLRRSSATRPKRCSMPCGAARGETKGLRAPSTRAAPSASASSFGSSRRAVSRRSPSKRRACASPSAAGRRRRPLRRLLLHPPRRHPPRSRLAGRRGALVRRACAGRGADGRHLYRAPSPGAPAFVEEGASVAVGQTLCILEAMKLMNEIKADLEGVIRKIHVANGDAVEFGQLLFEIEPVLGRPLDAISGF